jgi:menaquinone-dependent protoporphyrinogen IX oxidase
MSDILTNTSTEAAVGRPKAFRDCGRWRYLKGAVVYYTRWGNCRQVAEAIGRGLVESGHQVTVGAVGSIGEPAPDLEFIALGSGTRVGRPVGAIKRFISRRLKDDWRSRPFAAFGTGLVKFVEKDEPISADRIYELLEARGLKPIAPPFKAGVLDMHGPLAEGELERAARYGVEIGSKLKGSRPVSET